MGILIKTDGTEALPWDSVGLTEKETHFGTRYTREITAQLQEKKTLSQDFTKTKVKESESHSVDS